MVFFLRILNAFQTPFSPGADSVANQYMAFCGQASMQTPHPSQRSYSNTIFSGLHGTSMVMQYLMHFSHEVFRCSRMAFCGQALTHLLHLLHRAGSITGIFLALTVSFMSLYFAPK